MKNIILITTLAMLTGAITLKPLNARAQTTPAQNSPTQDPKQIEFIRTWQEACSKNDAENVEKCCQLSKELTDRYPDAGKQFIDAKKVIGKCALNKAEQKFTNALEAFYESAPEANKLDALFSAGDAYLEIDKDPQSPGHILTVSQLALAGQRAVVTGVYKNRELSVSRYTSLNHKPYQPTECSRQSSRDLNVIFVHAINNSYKCAA